MVLTFERLASSCDQPLLSPAGLRLFGGHTARVTGAQALASLGVDVDKIRILARHSGDTILRYVGDALLSTLATDLSSSPRAPPTPVPAKRPLDGRHL